MGGLQQHQLPVTASLLYVPSALGIRVSVFTVFQVITDVSGECMGEDVSVQWCKAL